MSGQLPLMDSLCGMQSCGDKIDIIVLCGIVIIISSRGTLGRLLPSLH